MIEQQPGRLHRLGPKTPRLTYEAKMERLRELGELQGEMAQKGNRYRILNVIDLALRFERASYAAMNARTFMQAALMAEREVHARAAIEEENTA